MVNFDAMSVWYQLNNKPNYWLAWQALAQTTSLMKNNLELLNRMYLRDAHCAIVCYDLSDENSLESAKNWCQEIIDNAPEECIKVLVGCKSDQKKPNVE